MARNHSNNFTTTTTASISAVATTLPLTSVTGLPTIGGVNFAYLTIHHGSQIEIVKATAVSSLNVTIVRAQEGTTGQIFNSGVYVSLRPTADSIDRKADGAASSTDNAVARFDLATGKILQNSLLVVDDTGATSGVTSLVMGGALSGVTSLTLSGAVVVATTTVANDDKVLLLDTSASDVTRTVTTQSIANLATSGYGSGVTAFLTTPSSANLAAAVTDETGTGSLVFANTPTLVTPILGTPTSGNISNCTSTSMVMVSPILGTPTSGTLTNCTIPTGAVTGWAAGINTFLVTPSSANLLSALTTSTGTGNNVFATSPTLVTPLLGTVTSGNISACTSTSMVMVTPVLGTPTSGNLANCTGYPTSGLDGIFTTEIVIDSTVNAGLGGATSGTHVSTNTAFGVGAFAATTSATGLGVAIGYHAGLVATSPDHSVFIGANAGVAITGSDNHVLIGWGAGAKLTTSTGCVAIGADAMSSTSATSSGNNVCVGYQAGRGTGTSQILSCVFIGYQAGSAGASVSNSVGIGATSLQGATAARNTGVGHNSGAAHTSGTDCCYFGNQSGEINNTGSKITAIGSLSFGSMGAAGGNNNNTGLGYATGKSGATGGASITTGSGNTFLGARATGTDAATANAIAIGQDAVALLATGATSGTFGPGIAIGSAAFPVGFRGDGTVIPCTAGAAGFWRVKVNGTQYYLPLITDASTTMPSEPAIAGGSNTQVQYNNSSVLAGITGATTDGTTLTLVAPVIGTPASGNLSNCTALPTGSITGWASGINTFLVTPSSANLIAAMTDETGTGACVFANTPTLVTPILGAATGTTLITSSNITAGLAAGSSAGTFISYSATTNKGSLILAAVANTGNTDTTISNAAMGQASIISIPDPGASTAKFILDKGTQSIAAGLTITSPTLVTPALGTVASGVISACTSTSMVMVTPVLGAASATSINFGIDALNYYKGVTGLTPTITFATPGDLTVSYFNQVGEYTRIGNLVTVGIFVYAIPTYTTASGNLLIQTLPYTANGSGLTYVGGGGGYIQGCTFPTGCTSVSFVALGGTTNATVVASGSGVNAVNFSTTQVPSGSLLQFQFSFNYFI